MPPPPTHSGAFSVLTATAAAKLAAKKAMVPADVVDGFKLCILKYKKLSKLGLVEMLSTEFPKCTKNQIKNSVEAVAERVGAGRNAVWELKAGP